MSRIGIHAVTMLYTVPRTLHKREFVSVRTIKRHHHHQMLVRAGGAWIVYGLANGRMHLMSIYRIQRPWYSKRPTESSLVDNLWCKSLKRVRTNSGFEFNVTGSLLVIVTINFNFSEYVAGLEYSSRNTSSVSAYATCMLRGGRAGCENIFFRRSGSQRFGDVLCIHSKNKSSCSGGIIVNVALHVMFTGSGGCAEERL